MQDEQLCNGIPFDHRLRHLLPNIKFQSRRGVGNHAQIVEEYGNQMVRDDGSSPSHVEAGFAAWLAKPETQGGVVVALLQPAKSQEYVPDFRTVNDKCQSLAYLSDTLTSVAGSEAPALTSIFDAFPFITKRIAPTQALSSGTQTSYDKFRAMLEAKKPDVVFACWRVLGQDLPFSGRGVGRESRSTDFECDDGHVIRIVNGFHPSHVANFHPHESCLRKLFSLELCKAFCEVDQLWKEEMWMDGLRDRCRQRTSQSMDELRSGGGQIELEEGRVLRNKREKESSRINWGYITTFDRGLDKITWMLKHMLTDEYELQSSQDLYDLIVSQQNTSEGACDVLLAVTETTRPAGFSLSGPDLNLRKHVDSRIHILITHDVPALLQYSEDLQKGVWGARFAGRLSQGLKKGLEKTTASFIDRLFDAFSGGARSWSYNPELLRDAFVKFAVDLEESLGEERDETLRVKPSGDSVADDPLSLPMNKLSLSTPANSNLTAFASTATPTRPPSGSICYGCKQPGHWVKDCAKSSGKSPKSRKSLATVACFKCGGVGHFANNCESPAELRACFRCGVAGHWAAACATQGRM